MRLNLRGLLAATLTPLQADGALNLDAIERQAETLASRGVVGAFVCGTTGEGQSLSSDERRKVAERWCEVARRPFAVIVHVGHSSLTEARQLAAHASRCRAAAVAAMAPNFFKPQTADDIVACCAQMASAAADLPFYYYHFPEMTGIPIRAADFVERAIERIPNFAGLKFTDTRMMDFGRCIDIAGERLDLCSGREEMLLAAWATGAQAAIGGTIALAAPLYRRIIDAFDAGDLPAARAAQAKARALIDVLTRFGGLRANKAAMNLLGPDCGPVRLPLRSLDEYERGTLRAELEAIGFFEFTRPDGSQVA